MRPNIISIIVSFLFFIYYFIFNGSIFSSSLGVAFSAFIFIDFLYKLGRVFPIKEFLTLIACIQWIVSAKISYSLGKVHHKYYMYVEEDVYMNYVVPGVIAMYLGLFLITNNLDLTNIKEKILAKKKQHLNIAFMLVFIGLTSAVLNKYLNIGGLAFFLFLANILLYVGVSYLFFIFPKYKWHLFFATIGVVLVLSINSGMFHNLLLVTSFFSFILVPKKTTFISKLLVVGVGFFLIYILQIVKQDFREIIWNKSNQNPVEVFFELVEKEFANQTLIGGSEELNPQQSKNAEEGAEANNRFNQGWIISKVLKNVPLHQDYLNGRTITEAIEASLLPRFLAPNKVGADQSLVNFKDVTGLALSDDTAMGLSLIAEFYANYGIVGGWIAMLIYGLVIALCIRLITNLLGKNSPLILLWIILFFFQVVKAETDLIKVFNHLIKSMMFFIIIDYSLRVININLFQAKKNID